jgi:hypothetical protein
MATALIENGPSPVAREVDGLFGDERVESTWGREVCGGAIGVSPANIEKLVSGEARFHGTVDQLAVNGSTRLAPTWSHLCQVITLDQPSGPCKAWEGLIVKAISAQSRKNTHKQDGCVGRKQLCMRSFLTTTLTFSPGTV